MIAFLTGTILGNVICVYLGIGAVLYLFSIFCVGGFSKSFALKPWVVFLYPYYFLKHFMR